MAKGVYERKPFTQQHKENISRSHLLNGVGKWNKGLIRDESFKQRVSQKLKGRQPSGVALLLGKDSPNWNENIGYRGLHQWVRRTLGVASVCEHCGKVGNTRQIQWANKSREYKRDVTDWLQLCVKCHKQYDKK